MIDKTVIYYSSNRENPKMEEKILHNLLIQKGDLPLITVTQKPCKVGHNICVGDLDLSYLNIYKQTLEGLKVATTDWILTAESDFLYPKDYFQMEPSGEGNIFRYDNIWILGKDYADFAKKDGGSEGAQLVNRKYFIDLLERYIADPPPNHRHSPYHRQVKTFVHGENPCISFKTGKGINIKTGLMDGLENRTKVLPYWGRISRIKQKYLWGNS